MATDPAPHPDSDPRQTAAAGDDEEVRRDERVRGDERLRGDERVRGDEDPRRAENDRRDPMGPPEEPCECYCLHCGRTFMSDGIWFQRVVGDPEGFDGFWMCPTPNCSGAGFTFDIFPTDPEHPANEGWCYSDDDEDDDEWSEEFDESGPGGKEYDPEETKWKALDAELDGAEPPDDDMEGEEWKYGLAPGERPAPRTSPMSPEALRQWEEAQREWEEEQKSYDEPDRRPRELDWSDRPDRRRGPGTRGGDGGDAGSSFAEDDIPF